MDEIYEVKDWIHSCFKVVEVRDYLRHPKPSGYRSLHVIVKVDGCLVEIQVRTIALDFWANLEHQIHYKKDIEDEELIRSELKRCADEIASLDLSFQTIKDRIEDNMRLLIADDEINLAKALQVVLIDAGYNCDVCFDGNSAIHLVSQEMYDGLILDIMMPEKNGYEVLSMIRKRK